MATRNPHSAELRYKVDIIMPDDTSEDGYGSSPPAVVVAGVWANVEDLTGLELVRAQMIADKATHRVTCRYDSRIQSGMQVSDSGRIYRIA
jgi:SPP1 family predicted phage head-tail adaptor